MRKLLEVIATSVEDAIEAEAGGADRIELVCDLALGGLTPALDVVTAVLQAVRIPVRIMLRENPTMSARDDAEIRRLALAAGQLTELPVDGIVAGFLKDESIDEAASRAVMEAAPNCRFTFHRAFDEVAEPVSVLQRLKAFPQVDRVLTSGGKGDWSERKQRLIEWQRAASPEITLLIGAGLSKQVLTDLARCPELTEVHIGRAARLGHSTNGRVARQAVQELRTILQ